MTFIHTKNPSFNSRRVVLVNTHGAVSDKWADDIVHELLIEGMEVIWIGNRESRVARAEYHIYFNEGRLLPDLAFEAFSGLDQFQQLLANACAVVSTDVNVVKICHDMRLPLAFLGIEACRPSVLGPEIARAVRKRYPITWRDRVGWQAFMYLLQRVHKEAYEGKPSGVKEVPISKEIMDALK